MKGNKLLLFTKRVLKHFRDFHIVWILLGVILITPFLFHIMSREAVSWIIYPTIALFFCYLIWKPLSAVYGLVGTSGSIKLYFFNFIAITFLFSIVYYWGFFKDAGISYDVNQPHIDYLMYAITDKDDTTKDNPQIIVSEKKDTIYLEHQIDSTSFTETVIHTTTDTLHYQPIGFLQVWRSTILTTLTQESADLLAIATVHNEAMESTNVGLDKEKSELFEWILIFHIIISWIFFGVFISLLYNKFRYES